MERNWGTQGLHCRLVFQLLQSRVMGCRIITKWFSYFFFPLRRLKIPQVMCSCSVLSTWEFSLHQLLYSVSLTSHTHTSYKVTLSFFLPHISLLPHSAFYLNYFLISTNHSEPNFSRHFIFISLPCMFKFLSLRIFPRNIKDIEI